jgi:hypothetical protein
MYCTLPSKDSLGQPSLVLMSLPLGLAVPPLIPAGRQGRRLEVKSQEGVAVWAGTCRCCLHTELAGGAGLERMQYVPGTLCPEAGLCGAPAELSSGLCHLSHHGHSAPARQGWLGFQLSLHHCPCLRGNTEPLCLRWNMPSPGLSGGAVWEKI